MLHHPVLCGFILAVNLNILIVNAGGKPRRVELETRGASIPIEPAPYLKDITARFDHCARSLAISTGNKCKPYHEVDRLYREKNEAAMNQAGVTESEYLQKSEFEKSRFVWEIDPVELSIWLKEEQCLPSGFCDESELCVCDSSDLDCMEHKRQPADCTAIAAENRAAYIAHWQTQVFLECSRARSSEAGFGDKCMSSEEISKRLADKYLLSETDQYGIHRKMTANDWVWYVQQKCSAIGGYCEGGTCACSGTGGVKSSPCRSYKRQINTCKAEAEKTAKYYANINSSFSPSPQTKRTTTVRSQDLENAGTQIVIPAQLVVLLGILTML